MFTHSKVEGEYNEPRVMCVLYCSILRITGKHPYILFNILTLLDTYYRETSIQIVQYSDTTGYILQGNIPTYCSIFRHYWIHITGKHPYILFNIPTLLDTYYRETSLQIVQYSDTTGYVLQGNIPRYCSIFRHYWIHITGKHP